MEYRIANLMKKSGNVFNILIYGDFEPLAEQMNIDSLGITIYPERINNSVIKSARTIHRAILKIKDKSIDSIIDAIRIINLFPGAYVLVTWGNCFCNWWSIITHNTKAQKVIKPVYKGYQAPACIICNS